MLHSHIRIAVAQQLLSNWAHVCLSDIGINLIAMQPGLFVGGPDCLHLRDRLRMLNRMFNLGREGHAGLIVAPRLTSLGGNRFFLVPIGHLFLSVLAGSGLLGQLGDVGHHCIPVLHILRILIHEFRGAINGTGLTIACSRFHGSRDGCFSEGAFHLRGFFVHRANIFAACVTAQRLKKLVPLIQIGIQILGMLIGITQQRTGAFICLVDDMGSYCFTVLICCLELEFTIRRLDFAIDALLRRVADTLAIEPIQDTLSRGLMLTDCLTGFSSNSFRCRNLGARRKAFITTEAGVLGLRNGIAIRVVGRRGVCDCSLGIQFVRKYLSVRIRLGQSIGVRLGVLGVVVDPNSDRGDASANLGTFLLDAAGSLGSVASLHHAGARQRLRALFGRRQFTGACIKNWNFWH